jgi:hypothetical protein
MELSTRSDLNRPHFKRVNCSCTVCKADRNTGCHRPFRYHEEREVDVSVSLFPAVLFKLASQDALPANEKYT